jgi:DNA polymerase I-like protein with 3'-5' exonuclease and polymerase domains
MIHYSKVAAFGVNPEDYINITLVETPTAYKAAMEFLKDYKIVSVDSETVGLDVQDLFMQQLELENQYTAMINSDPEFYESGEESLNELKRLRSEYESYLKNKYNSKTTPGVNMILPDERATLTLRRKAVKEAETTYTSIISCQKLITQHERLQKKIDQDESGLKFNRNILALVQVGTMDGHQFLIDPRLIQDDFKEWIKTRTAIIGANLKFDMVQFYFHLGIRFDDAPVVCYDIQLAAKMVKSGLMRSFSLQNLSKEFLGYFQSKEERLSYWLRRPLTPDQTKYAALDVITPNLLFYILKQEIKEAGVEEATKLQMEFLKVLTKTEITGLYIDLKGIKEIEATIDLLAEEKRTDLANTLGDDVWFNPEKGHREIKNNKDFGSPKVTLEQLKAYGKKHRIMPLTFLSSTSADAFEEIEEDIPLLTDITTFRSLMHTKNTYCQPMLDFNIDSRIHSSFVQISREGTRMSSNSPNVQNWPRPLERQTPAERLRDQATPTPGYRLYDADYGAIELCMIAYYSQDYMMLKAINEGVDLHALTANRIFSLGYTYEELSDKATLKEFKKKYGKERQIAKTFNFAVVYGAGPNKLRKQLMIEANIYDLSEEELRTMKAEWYALYPGVQTWQNNILHVAKHYGLCTTRMGRNIYFEEPSKVYSKAFNTPIQASCYEGLQKAGIIFNQKVRKLEEEGKILPDSIRIVNFIHDEFLVEAAENISEKSVIKLINESMIEGMQPLMERYETPDMIYERVNVSVDCSRVEKWGDKG